MPKKKPKQGKPEVHDDLKGFDIKINEFGEIVSNYDVEKLNEFLNENVDDKKLRDLDDSEPLEERAEEDEETGLGENLFHDDDEEEDSGTSE